MLRQRARIVPRYLLNERNILALQQSRFYHDDPTLSWARQNPALAQKCLECPPWREDACDASFWNINSDSLEGFSLWRKWIHVWPAEDARDSFLTEKTLAISSHILTAPLTLAKFITTSGLTQNCRICCVGARAESSLPFEIWKEYLLFTSSLTKTSISTTLDFVGPDIVGMQGKTPNRTVELEAGSTLLLRWYYKGLFHDLLEQKRSANDEWDAFVFFNPGFGHPHLKKDWIPTLERIIPLGRPMLFTAHSQMDSQRDAEHLKQTFGLELQYEENPFASRICFQDPFEKNHSVRPNHYVVHVAK